LIGCPLNVLLFKRAGGFVELSSRALVRTLTRRSKSPSPLTSSNEAIDVPFPLSLTGALASVTGTASEAAAANAARA